MSRISGIPNDAPIADLPAWTRTLAQQVLDQIYPVGSIYLSMNAANPGAIIGGTWQQFGQGRTLIGFGNNTLNGIATPTAPDIVGGSNAITLTAAQSGLPAHNHPMGHTHPINHNHGTVQSDLTNIDHAHGLAPGNVTVRVNNGVAAGSAAGIGAGANATAGASSAQPAHMAGTTQPGGGNHRHPVPIPNFTGTSGASSAATTGNNAASNAAQPFDNRPAFISVAMWRRIA